MQKQELETGVTSVFGNMVSTRASVRRTTQRLARQEPKRRAGGTRQRKRRVAAVESVSGAVWPWLVGHSRQATATRVLLDGRRPVLAEPSPAGGERSDLPGNRRKTVWQSSRRMPLGGAPYRGGSGQRCHRGLSRSLEDFPYPHWRDCGDAALGDVGQLWADVSVELRLLKQSKRLLGRRGVKEDEVVGVRAGYDTCL